MLIKKNPAESLGGFLYFFILRGLSHWLGDDSNAIIANRQESSLATGNLASQQCICQLIIDIGLDSPAQRSSTILLVETFLQQEVARLIADLQSNTLLTQACTHLVQEQINNLVEFRLAQGMEDHYLVNTVDELWPEHALQT